MSTWTVPISSSPPSTPGSHKTYDNSFASNLSTTPAGAPPSTTKSFTPAGPPPSSVSGSSPLGSRNALYKSNSDIFMNLNSSTSHNGISSKIHPPSKIALSSSRHDHSTQNLSFTVSEAAQNGALKISTSRNGQTSGHMFNDSYLDDLGDMDREDEEEDDEDYSDGSERDSMSFKLNTESRFKKSFDPGDSLYNDMTMSDGDLDNRSESSSERETPRGIKRSRGGAPIYNSLTHKRMARGHNDDSAIPLIAKKIASRIGVAKLDDPDNLILKTEPLVTKLNAVYAAPEEQEKVLENTLSTVSEELKSLWYSCRDNHFDKPATENDYVIGIGPEDNAPGVLKAVFLASLLLQLHHPPPAKGKQAFAITRQNRSSHFSTSIQSNYTPLKLDALPKVLVDWLDDNHDPYSIAIANLFAHQPNPTAGVSFWDLLFTIALRGHISQVIVLLKKSDFKVARTAKEDGQGQDGYHGMQLGNIERAINRAIQVLEHCPAVEDGDWNVTGAGWRVFRKRVEQALDDLAIFAEGHDRDRDPVENVFEAENFGIKSPTMSLSHSTRKAESRVPWTVYQNLKTMYGILLGGTPEILSSAQDWVEATVGLTVWWDGNDDDDEVAVGSLAMTRRSLRHSHSRDTRLVDLNPTTGYLRRLSFAFEQATEDSNDHLFRINSLNPVEVALASIFEGNVDNVVMLLRGWSLPVASAVVEVASLGGWYDPSPGPAIVDGFNESDLMVLSSYGQPSQEINRDIILGEYADAIFKKDNIRESDKEAKEGWELSIAILTRLDDTDLANKKVGELLSQIPLSSDERVDKILGICRVFNMDREAQTISERYADSIAEESDRYGTALLYYAKAHCTKKVKGVLDLLISLSLVQSLAYPPTSSLDNNLRALLFLPEKSLDEIAESDREAAGILHRYLTGYATLRKFYDLRDEEVNLKNGKKPTLKPIARKRAAMGALLAVIDSAADNIHGGLYDEQRGSIVQVDGLLTLLGEAMVFVDQPKRMLTLSQCFTLLKAIEDLQTVTPRIFKQCEECFRSTLATANSSQRTRPSRELLKKTVSSLASSSSFSLIGSSMLGSGTSKEGGGTESGSGSGWLVKAASGDGDGVKRGWDWRHDLEREAKGDDVLRMLRLGLAKEISRAWVEGDLE